MSSFAVSTRGEVGDVIKNARDAIEKQAADAEPAEREMLKDIAASVGDVIQTAARGSNTVLVSVTGEARPAAPASFSCSIIVTPILPAS